MRINKFLALAGVASRRKAEEYILNKQICINGTLADSLSADIDVKKDVVTLDGVIVAPPSTYEYYMLNKPRGVICSISDEKDRKTVMDIVKVKNRIHPVGRLDYDSEGMLILTNDGDLTYTLTHPKNQIPKTYIVKIEGDIKESELAVLRAGVVVDGEKFGECKVKRIDFKDNTTKLELILKEGKNREIRRMMDAINKNIIWLNRVQIGGLKLGGISRGEFRALKPYEVKLLTQNIEAKK